MVGDLEIVIDHKQQPALVSRITQVKVLAFNQVSQAYAAIEGEGDGSLDGRRPSPLAFLQQGVQENRSPASPGHACCLLSFRASGYGCVPCRITWHQSGFATARVPRLRAPVSSSSDTIKTAMRTVPIEFQTRRLAFVAWQDRHRTPFAEINSDPRVMRYFPALLTTEQSNAGIDIWQGQFAEKGWSNWAVELRESGEFIGFIGLSVPRRLLPFSPCTEIGWRLKPSAWGHGYATEGAKACLRIGFERLGLQEIVSFTTLANLPSIAVMQRIGMTNTNQDFEHPAVPEGNALRPHCLYKLTRAQWQQRDV